MRYFGITDLALASFFLAILECGIQTYSAILTMAESLCLSWCNCKQINPDRPLRMPFAVRETDKRPSDQLSSSLREHEIERKGDLKKKRSRRSLSRREVDFLVWRLSDRISGLSGKISSQRPPGSPWKKAISPQLLQWSVLTVSGRKPWVHWEALRCELL